MVLVEKTIGQVLDENAQNYPDEDAVVYADRDLRYSWLRLKKVCDRVAKSFIALGLEKGEHVAIWGTNRPEWLITQLAAAKIGCPLITINPEWKPAELEYALKQSDTKVLVMIDGFEKRSGNEIHKYDYVKILQHTCPELFENFLDVCTEAASTRIFDLNLQKFPVLRHVILATEKEEKPHWALAWRGLCRIGEEVSDETLARREASVQSRDVCLIQYTSGTTGFPKGAMLTHYGVINNGLEGCRNMELTHEDRLCGPVPYYHIFGSIMVNICCLSVGAATVIPAEHFSARKTLEAIERERCTALHGVPTMFIEELADPEFSRFDLRSLRTGIMAGAPCPIELMRDVVYRMGARKITIVYGLSEASPITHQTRPEDSIERRVSTVGKPLDNVEAKIVDAARFDATGEIVEVPNGERGEIWARGYNIMKGYYKKPEETAKTIVDDWLRTGDLGIRDEAGYYKIAGRLKEMFIVGGHNVYPAEIEQTLLTLFEDSIEQVYIVGVPHKKLQEICAAVIKLKAGKTLTLQEIKAKCSQEMEWPKVPRHVKFVEDFSMAMTVTGKIQKFKLKEILVKELGLEDLTKIKTA